MELYVVRQGTCTCTPFDESVDGSEDIRQALSKTMDNGLALRMFDNTVALTFETFDAARRLFQEKAYQAQDTEKLQALPENFSCMAIGTFMQILGDQLLEDTRTITPFANISSKLQPKPPLISPSRFAIMFLEARRRTAHKQGYTVYAGLLASEMKKREEDEKKKWAELAAHEREQLQKMAQETGRVAQLLLLYHDRENQLHIDKLQKTGALVEANIQNKVQELLHAPV